MKRKKRTSDALEILKNMTTPEERRLIAIERKKMERAQKAYDLRHKK